MPRRTPQEKKELDYKKQRRTHWDNDKAARKAIPAAKARKNRTIRRESKRAIQAEPIEELAIGSMVSIDRIAPSDKHWGGHTLKEHLQRQAARRSSLPRRPLIDDSWGLENLRENSDASYSEKKHHRALHNLFRRYEVLFTPKSLGKSWIRRDLDGILRLADSQLLRGFLAAEPKWKRELELWHRRALAAADAKT